METIIVPITEPKRRPADIVNGMAGIARTYNIIKKTTVLLAKIQKYTGRKHLDRKHMLH